MAGHGDTSGHAEASSAMDMPAHQASYDSFMAWLKVGAAISFVIGMIVTVILAS